VERAYKYHGLGNDFVLLDRRQGGADIDAPTARALCERRRGVGADGVLVLLDAEAAAVRMIVHNADGSLAEMCGNGIRCVVKHVVDHSANRAEEVPISTDAGLRVCKVRYNGGQVADVEVEMGAAGWSGPHLPEGGWLDASIPGHPGLRGTSVSMGNPHLVLFDRPQEEAQALGSTLERHPAFAQRTNVEWARAAPGGLEVVVWERGVGFTQACGTGACAVASAAVRLGKAHAAQWLSLFLPGGRLEVRVAPDFSSVRLRGPATFAFEAVLPAPGTP
jgi:diaminopimelate epimerase